MFQKNLLTGACLLALANYSQAGDSVDLKVTGKLLTGSCTPTLSNGGVVDFGHIPLNNLNKTTVNQLGFKTTELSITCTSDMKMAWTILDNHHDSVAATVTPNADASGAEMFSADNEKYGLGKTAGGVQIGAYGVRVTSVYYNALTGKELYTDSVSNNYIDPNVVWKTVSNSGAYMRSDGSRALTQATSTETVPVAAKDFKYVLCVSAAVNGTDTLAITDNTDLDGSATISLVYL